MQNIYNVNQNTDMKNNCFYQSCFNGDIENGVNPNPPDNPVNPEAAPAEEQPLQNAGANREDIGKQLK